MDLCFEMNSQFQEMKDMHFIEHKRLMDLLDAEREQILIEKTKLETMERIKPTSYPSIGKRHTELDAAIKIAQVIQMFGFRVHREIIIFLRRRLN